MINQVELKLGRKRPVRHSVKSHNRKDGSHVRDHERGSGVRASRPSRVVGVGNKELTAKLLKSLPHFQMEISGHGAPEFNDWLKSQGYQVRNLSMREIKDYFEMDEEDAKYTWEAQKKDSYKGLDYGAHTTPFLISKAGKPVGVWEYSKH